MKFIINIFILIVVLLWTGVSFSYAWTLDSYDNVKSTWDTLRWDSDNEKIQYCDWDDECWIKEWIEKLQGKIDDVEEDRALSEYVQDIIEYLLWFITLIAVIYIIYAWFNILIWWWDEEKLKKSKSTILYVVIWMAVIWLSYSIVTFVIQVLNS